MDKDTVTNEFNEQMHQSAGDLGLKSISVSVRDVILPRDMKDLANNAAEAEKAAEANLIARREETAACVIRRIPQKLLAAPDAHATARTGDPREGRHHL